MKEKEKEKEKEKREDIKKEESSFEHWDETLDRIEKRVSQNPQNFENKAEILLKFLQAEHDYCNLLNLAIKVIIFQKTKLRSNNITLIFFRFFYGHYKAQIRQF